MRGREGGREAGPADTHFLSRSLCVTQDRPISSQRSLTERLSLSPLAFQIVPSPLTRLTSAPPLPSPSAPFNTSLLTIVCLQNDNIAGRRQYYECHYSCYYQQLHSVLLAGGYIHQMLAKCCPASSHCSRSNVQESAWWCSEETAATTLLPSLPQGCLIFELIIYFSHTHQAKRQLPNVPLIYSIHVDQPAFRKWAFLAFLPVYTAR